MNLEMIIPALRIILGFLYLATGLLKIQDLNGFRAIIARYEIFPRFLVRPIAYTHPVVECTIGIWILTGIYLLYATLAGLILILSSDIVILILLLTRKKLKNCGCFGTTIISPLSLRKLAENLIYTALFIFLLLALLQAKNTALI